MHTYFLYNYHSRIIFHLKYTSFDAFLCLYKEYIYSEIIIFYSNDLIPPRVSILSLHWIFFTHFSTIKFMVAFDD